VFRSPATTRIAVVGDVPVLLDLLAAERDLGGRAERAVNPAGSGDVAEALTALITGEDSQVVLACVEDEPAGLVVMRLIRPDPLSDARLVQLAHLVVAAGHRHRGVGHALVESGAAFAAEHHAEHVSVSVFPSLRDASRFFARLGFAPAAIFRVAPLGLLRKRLCADRGAAPLADGQRRRTRMLRPVPLAARPRDEQKV